MSPIHAIPQRNKGTARELATLLLSFFYTSCEISLSFSLHLQLQSVTENERKYTKELSEARLERIYIHTLYVYIMYICISCVQVYIYIVEDVRAAESYERVAYDDASGCALF